MPSFHDWLDRVLSRGESVQEAPPGIAPPERAVVEARLEAAFELHALDVAGPPIPFDPKTAIAAALALAQACWHLVGDDPQAPAELSLDAAPSPSAHLSADVTLLYLPAVYRRARLRAPHGPLAAAADRLLRAWPLSGVLADLDGAPSAATEFAHPGLQLLYAERLAGNSHVGWVPDEGPAREWVDRVFSQNGRPVPAPQRECPRV